MRLFVLPYCANMTTVKCESIVSAIENGAPVPQFKSPNCALWYTTHAHCATRRVRLLVPVVSKLCHYRVWHSVGSMKTSSKVLVCKYLTEYYFLCVHVFYHALLGCFFVVCLDPSLAKDGC